MGNENPDSVLKTTFEIQGLEALYTLAAYKWKYIRKNSYRYDWIYIELLLEYIYSYDWVDKIFQPQPTCPMLRTYLKNQKHLVTYDFTMGIFTEMAVKNKDKRSQTTLKSKDYKRCTVRSRKRQNVMNATRFLNECMWQINHCQDDSDIAIQILILYINRRILRWKIKRRKKKFGILQRKKK
ncbi:hypothetical protein CEXT_46811 [Caerostris extrusa]|uniref:Uncharacterized protein n=1 Tax=Caerostris extrusa TaxID=172846 RepID=A0AAV4TH13_CAEEX|nr:hypothetical protein CEXT_46811 [Caerostris extrusa]